MDPLPLARRQRRHGGEFLDAREGIGSGGIVVPLRQLLKQAGDPPLHLGGVQRPALVVALESFEGLLRLVLSAIWFLLGLAALDLCSWRLGGVPPAEPAE